MSSVDSRDERVRSLATKITLLLRRSKNRAEAIDAHDMARIIFRREAPNRLDLTSSPILEESLAGRPLTTHD